MKQGINLTTKGFLWYTVCVFGVGAVCGGIEARNPSTSFASANNAVVLVCLVATLLVGLWVARGGPGKATQWAVRGDKADAKLKEIKHQKDSALITEVEYQAKRKEILDPM